ncbi:MSMEG_0570 family nitrogen starvation response protein [Rhizobiaceae bacterium BDR2-2]|uniref:MSMEG_0570 family nitrogen starvation response protein n=1 Tax=Ectorhizobium quercum TaxID=2965071 RepID=A0AAE3N4U8_9HYPH|nr:MSMEG_0570 family nitrogen starvation response protein [Ectorhizobium quercum]MCX8999719.1 MSMEG_0570 family nitrogen starvation response protein [Ectorhizobium quercum]
MPEMRFIVTWPDGQDEECYSPSLVIRDYFEEGSRYPLADFLTRSREALTIASDRVKARYGHACSLALGQLSRIEQRGRAFGDPQAEVQIKTFLL